ncbi:MAG: LysM peptidoglycan-binding domain-containing protein [Chloroflexi bacterium]|nr:LysM peptidoglycan-binding domain-containing protein [Chloroflexota bacterium]
MTPATQRHRIWSTGWTVFLSCLCLLTGLARSVVPALAAPLSSSQVIVIDPGHGGTDSGAQSSGLLEKNITLATGLKVAALLRSSGYDVVLTRTSDTYVSLAERCAIANRAGATVFVSLHANAIADPYINGLTTFYGRSSGYVSGAMRSPQLVQRSRLLASAIQYATAGRTGAFSRGVHSADFWVLGNVHAPAVLVEMGYITNPHEAALLAAPGYEQDLAGGIVTGIEDYLSGSVSATSAVRGQAASSTASTYTVRPGDTLSAIALQLGISLSSLIQTNHLENANSIVAGQVLIIPSMQPASVTTVPSGSLPRPGTTAPQTSSSYTVRPGDTLSRIASRLGVSQESLLLLNHLPNPNVLIAGDVLTLPSPGQSQAGTGPAATASAPAPESASGQAYVIRPGDTLSALALRFRVSLGQLLQANSIALTTPIIAGQALQIPLTQDVASAASTPLFAPRVTAGSYIVQRGDTLSLIAQRYHTSVEALMQINDLNSADRVYAGERIRL